MVENGFNAGHWQALATVFAGYLTIISALIAAGVAGVVAFIIGRKQNRILEGQLDIQNSLASIERTKIRLDLVERRGKLISEIESLFGQMMAAGMSKSMDAKQVEDIEKASFELYSVYRSNKVLFDDRAEPCLSEIPQTCLSVQILIIQLRNGSEQFEGITERAIFENAWNAVTKLNSLAETYLEPQTKVFTEVSL